MPASSAKLIRKGSERVQGFPATYPLGHRNARAAGRTATIDCNSWHGRASATQAQPYNKFLDTPGTRSVVVKVVGMSSCS